MGRLHRVPVLRKGRVVYERVYVYKGRIRVYVPITVPAGVEGGQHEIRLTLQGGLCEEKGVCLVLRDDVTDASTVTVGPRAVANPAWWKDADVAAARTVEQLKAARQAAEVSTPAAEPAETATVVKYLALALLAGLILNVMPCVLPVIPLRVLSIVQMAGESRRRYVTLGLTFAAGVLLFFVAVAGVNVALRLTVGRALRWSEHYQLPAVRIALTMVVVALAANLFGLFHVVVPRRVAAMGAGERKRQGHLASLGMGLMLAILATPCTFAVLTGTLAWAQLQPLWLATLAFVLIGVGMAAPHALLCAFPQLVRRLPKPGRWMELLKQTMGFLLLLAGVYLLSTLGDDPYPAWVAGFAVILAMGLWVWGTWVRYDAPLVRKIAARGIVAGVVIAAGWWMLPPPKPLAVPFEPFDPARITELRDDGYLVLLKFTASWCTSCKVVDATVYNNQHVAEALRERGVVAIKADVTNLDSAASKYMKQRFDRSAPPLTVILSAGDGPPVLLEGQFPKDKLLDALNQAVNAR
jgi:thiol:disulfide interchange protein DsbD